MPWVQPKDHVVVDQVIDKVCRLFLILCEGWYHVYGADDLLNEDKSPLRLLLDDSLSDVLCTGSADDIAPRDACGIPRSSESVTCHEKVKVAKRDRGRSVAVPEKDEIKARTAVEARVAPHDIHGWHPVVTRRICDPKSLVQNSLCVWLDLIGRACERTHRLSI